MADCQSNSCDNDVDLKECQVSSSHKPDVKAFLQGDYKDEEFQKHLETFFKEREDAFEDDNLFEKLSKGNPFEKHIANLAQTAFTAAKPITKFPSPEDNNDFMAEEPSLLGANEGIASIAFPPDAKTIIITDQGGLAVGNASDYQGVIIEAQQTYGIGYMINKEKKLVEGYPNFVREVPDADKDNNLFSLTLQIKTLLALALMYSPIILGYNQNKNKPSIPDDDYFVMQRLAGVNPLPIHRLKGSDSEADIRKLFQDAGKPLPADGENLFVNDYRWMQSLSKQVFSNKVYVPSPVSVMQYTPASGTTKESMKPLSIYLDAQQRFKPLVVEQNNANANLWRFAKSCVRCADWSAHEIGSHLTESHLVTEVSTLATYRNLPVTHPIYQLLLPHFFRTLPLNANARAVLVPTIIAENLVPFDLQQCNEVVAASYKQWNFKEKYVPNDLNKRGVNNFTAEFYPFGPVSLAVWNALHGYVTKFLKDVLETVDWTAEQLLQDYYLAQWIGFMEQRMKGFVAPTTVDELVDVLTMIIYVSSYQHSAVNYFQELFLSYIPGNPSCLHVDNEGVLDVSNLTSRQMRDMYPTKQQGNLTQKVVTLLSQLPEDVHQLVQFKYDNSDNAYLSKWVDAHYKKVNILEPLNFQNPLDQELKAFGAQVSAGVSIIQPKNLAQSVLI